MQIRDKLYINGQWATPAGPKTIDVRSASTEAVIGRVPEGTPEDADAAVLADRAAFESWAATSVPERARFLARIHEGLEARAEDIGRTIAGEVGMPLKLATRIQAELNFSAAVTLVGSVTIDTEKKTRRVIRTYRGEVV